MNGISTARRAIRVVVNRAILRSWRSIDRFAVIIGGMRCGTTSLYRYLCGHPHVCPCRSKEPGYFTQREFNWSLEDYQSLWHSWHPARHRLALEASVHYTKIPSFPNAAERIAEAIQHDPFDIRFIYLLRDPIERIESWYRYRLAEKGIALPGHDEPVAEYAVNVSRYWMQIREYCQRFSTDRILMLRLSEMESNRRDVLERIRSFLELDEAFAFAGSDRTHNSSRDLLRRSRHAADPNSPDPSLRWHLSVDQKRYVQNQLRDDLILLRQNCGVDTSDWLCDDRL